MIKNDLTSTYMKSSVFAVVPFDLRAALLGL